MRDKGAHLHHAVATRSAREGLSTCGKYANFTGPKKVECSPMPTRHSSSNAGHCMTKPSKATAMMAISQS